MDIHDLFLRESHGPTKPLQQRTGEGEQSPVLKIGSVPHGMISFVFVRA